MTALKASPNPDVKSLSKTIDLSAILAPFSMREEHHVHPHMTVLSKPKLKRFVAIVGPTTLVTMVTFSGFYYLTAPSEANAAVLLYESLVALWLSSLFILSLVVGGWLITNKVIEKPFDKTPEATNQPTTCLQVQGKTDQTLQEAKQLAESANEAKSRYLTSISHELRTPLQSILGYSQLLNADPTISVEQRDALGIIQRSGEHLADLIEGLLDISRIEAGKLDVHIRQIDLHQLLAQIVNIFSQQAHAKSIDFTYEASRYLPRYVRADEKCLRQILTNIISNGIKFTENGRVHFAVRYRNQVAEFTVTDTGVGIAEDELKRIFKPFERIFNPDVSPVSGTGLGLSIVEFLCDLLGGDISVASVLGEGSRFKIMLMLPSIDVPILSETDIQPVIGYTGARQTVFVVDDEADHRQLITDFLTPLGFQVHEAEDAPSCLTLLKKQQPDLFLIDVSMPHATGIQLSDSLRSLGMSSPIIMLSADAEARHNNQEKRFSHDMYMIKPINLQTLLEHLKRLLKVEWVYRESAQAQPPPIANPMTFDPIPQHVVLDQLCAYADIGYAKGVNESIKKLRQITDVDPSLTEHLASLAVQHLHKKIADILRTKPQ